MIPDNLIREEKYNGAYMSLENLLADISMTKTERDLIQRDLDYMEQIFREANG